LQQKGLSSLAILETQKREPVAASVVGLSAAVAIEGSLVLVPDAVKCCTPVAIATFKKADKLSLQSALLLSDAESTTISRYNIYRPGITGLSLELERVFLKDEARGFNPSTVLYFFRASNFLSGFGSQASGTQAYGLIHPRSPFSLSRFSKRKHPCQTSFASNIT
jgi:hypothetical protein